MSRAIGQKRVLEACTQCASWHNRLYLTFEEAVSLSNIIYQSMF